LAICSVGIARWGEVAFHDGQVVIAGGAGSNDDNEFVVRSFEVRKSTRLRMMLEIRGTLVSRETERPDKAKTSVAPGNFPTAS
jgi:hypothetical protein